MPTTMPSQYYSRFDPALEYEEHLFVAGRGLQSAELNDIQKQGAFRLRGVADALFKDGDVVRDASIIVNAISGVVQCQAGAVYIRGAVRGVAPTSFTIPVSGEVAVGIRLVESVVTALEDPDLRDPATGTRNYDEPGAERLRVTPEWAWDSDGGTGEFFPVYAVVDGIAGAKEPPPNLDAVTQALARYDRDSAGGSYVVSGLMVQKLADEGANQVYSLSAGRARVFGYGVDFATSRRVVHAAVPDLKVITNEPHLSSTAAAQRVDFDRWPGTDITAVSITAEKTVTLTHGVTSGAQDPLPDTSVLQILAVSQGAQIYTATTDYLLTAGKVDWSPAGAEPAPGSTYSVTYQYITLTTPTLVDDTGFTVTGAVDGTLILVSYSQKLPRYDRMCVNPDGQIVWFTGVAAEYFPQQPTVPGDLLPLASVYQTWMDSREVQNDGVRVVPMPQLSRVESRMDLLAQLIAQQRLESNIHTREAGTKKGLFTDPFTDDSQRDAGTAQTAAVVNGELMLPISAAVHQVGSDVVAPASLARTDVIALEQTLRTGNMKINPYMAFDAVPAAVTLTPAVDRWTEVQTDWLSPVTARWWWWNWWSRRSARDVLVSQTTESVEFLRQITVAFSVSGFGASEALSSLTFDGIVISTGPLSADLSGVLSGSFAIPAGIPAGTKLVEVIGAGGSRGTAVFVGEGTITTEAWQRRRRRTVRIDPLAQTFVLPVNTQVTGVDLFFATASTSDTMVQIRETSNGLPTQTVLAEAILDPADIVLAGAHTRVVFDGPVHLLGDVEYAVVVLCNDAVGALSVAELGKFDAAAQRWITSQPYTVGVLLSSSNASTWTAHQDRDMAFRILGAAYTESSRIVALGNVSVTGATDLILASFTDRPASATGVEYTLTLPDASVLTVADGQSVQLASAVTGDIGVAAHLSGSASFSPVLFPGTQVVAGTVAPSGDYVSRAIPAGASSAIKVIFEAVIPSGATVDVFYKGPDIGDTWQPVSAQSNTPADDGFTEFVHFVTAVNELSVQIKLVLNGTTAARPRVRDLRTIVTAA